VTEAGKNEIVQKFYVAVTACDLDLLKAVVTDDVVWTLPGKSLMSTRSWSTVASGT
jgi:ketosteroid isomerase-like protein